MVFTRAARAIMAGMNAFPTSLRGLAAALVLSCTLAALSCGDDAATGTAADALFTDVTAADTGAPPDTAPAPVCGDGVTEPPEGCDDGDELNGTYDHCAADCSGPGPRCGDGVIDEA